MLYLKYQNAGRLCDFYRQNTLSDAHEWIFVRTIVHHSKSLYRTSQSAVDFSLILFLLFLPPPDLTKLAQSAGGTDTLLWLAAIVFARFVRALQYCTPHLSFERPRVITEHVTSPVQYRFFLPPNGSRCGRQWISFFCWDDGGRTSVATVDDCPQHARSGGVFLTFVIGLLGHQGSRRWWWK